MSEPYDSLARVAVVAILIALNGFFVATEFALVGSRRTRIEELATQGVAGAAHVKRALADIDRYIAATQLGITMASLSLGWLGEPVFAQLFHSALSWLPGSVESEIVAGTIAFMLITTLHIVFGELAPKSIALSRPERTALFVIMPTALFMTVFKPAIWLLNEAGRLAVRAFRMTGTPEHGGATGVHSAEEIEMLVDQSAQVGALADLEGRMLHGVFDVGDRIVRQVMVRRTRIMALPLNATADDAMRQALAARHSRLPVYDGDLDHIVGFVHLRSVLEAYLADRGGAQTFEMKSLIHLLPAVPESMSLDTVLEHLRVAGVRMAQVVDEHGGTAGIITYEGILAMIAGQLPEDASTSGVSHVEPQPDGSWLLDGQAGLEETDQQLGTRLADAVDRNGDPLGVDTVGGLILARLGRLGSVGDVVVEGPEPPVSLRIEEMDDRRIARVRLTGLAGQL